MNPLQNQQNNDGYQPITEGYSPVETKGYTPNAGASTSSNPPTAPVGGSGESATGQQE